MYTYYVHTHTAQTWFQLAPLPALFTMPHGCSSAGVCMSVCMHDCVCVYVCLRVSTQDFCAEKGVACMVEHIPIDYVNTAYDRVVKADVRYR